VSPVGGSLSDVRGGGAAAAAVVVNTVAAVAAAAAAADAVAAAPPVAATVPLDPLFDGSTASVRARRALRRARHHISRWG
jgi:hypothetical protein